VDSNGAEGFKMTAKSDATHAEIDHFYGRYIDLFNDGRVAEMQDLFEFPWAMLSTRGPFFVSDQEAGLALYTKVWKDLKGEGWATTNIEKLEWFAVGPDGALLQVDFVRFRTDGTTMLTGRAYYAARRREGVWRINTIYHN
jgi:uncharacterized NTF2-like protein DUF6841